jgi:hypothetical protein
MGSRRAQYRLFFQRAIAVARKSASNEKDLLANPFHPMREELQTCSLKHF